MSSLGSAPPGKLPTTACSRYRLNSTCATPWPLQVKNVEPRKRRAGVENARTASRYSFHASRSGMRVQSTRGLDPTRNGGPPGARRITNGIRRGATKNRRRPDGAAVKHERRLSGAAVTRTGNGNVSGQRFDLDTVAIAVMRRGPGDSN